MPVGLAAATANAVLDYVFNNTAPAAITNVWVQLHIGDPGAAGTTRQKLYGST